MGSNSLIGTVYLLHIDLDIIDNSSAWTQS